MLAAHWCLALPVPWTESELRGLLQYINHVILLPTSLLYSGAITLQDVGSAITIQGGTLSIDGVVRTVKWGTARPQDISGVIKSARGHVNGEVRVLVPGMKKSTILQNPRRVWQRKHSPMLLDRLSKDTRAHMDRG